MCSEVDVGSEHSGEFLFFTFSFLTQEMCFSKMKSQVFIITVSKVKIISFLNRLDR